EGSVRHYGRCLGIMRRSAPLTCSGPAARVRVGRCATHDKAVVAITSASESARCIVGFWGVRIGGRCVGLGDSGSKSSGGAGIGRAAAARTPKHQRSAESM
ncbi:MAG TPA: hypothetical protein PLX06_13825, partial [Fimbriimonadaceae bacterium]|nr:hypothetical protein [Fimbriimonadaceae bacterium]